jgi:hypothetical protein
MITTVLLNINPPGPKSVNLIFLALTHELTHSKEHVMKLPVSEPLSEYYRLCFRPRATLLCWFSVSFTTTKKQRSRILEAYENKIYYTPEDGHVGRNM